MGDGNPFRVESLLPSKYALCDNKWHNISALYDYEQLALRIDQMPTTIAVAQQTTMGRVQTKSPMYIGGIPGKFFQRFSLTEKLLQKFFSSLFQSFYTNFMIFIISFCLFCNSRLLETASSGSLLTRENFKGCIRNLSIRNERRDWVDMDALHNVLLSECLLTGTES